MLPMIHERQNEYHSDFFLNELFEASKLLGMLEAKIDGYQFGSILVPMLRNKEAISSMAIEGTQTTLSNVIEDRINPAGKTNDKIIQEYRNHTDAILYGTDYLRGSGFTDELIKELHRIMLTGISPEASVGKYKTKDNYIVNSAGSVVFTPPSYKSTQKYMRELLAYINDTADGVNPLIKAAIMHAQFESIHPFEDGNGRVGRLLVSLYLYKAGVINFPFFYISEAICQDKAVYYNKLTSSRESGYDEWIRFFLQKCVVQAKIHIGYIDSLNVLFEKTKDTVRESVNSPKFDQIIDCIFTQPVLTVSFLAEHLSVTTVQARRYVDKLEEIGILQGDDRKRGRKYYFTELLDLARR